MSMHLLKRKNNNIIYSLYIGVQILNLPETIVKVKTL